LELQRRLVGGAPVLDLHRPDAACGPWRAAGRNGAGLIVVEPRGGGSGAVRDPTVGGGTAGAARQIHVEERTSRILDVDVHTVGAGVDRLHARRGDVAPALEENGLRGASSGEAAEEEGEPDWVLVGWRGRPRRPRERGALVDVVRFAVAIAVDAADDRCADAGARDAGVGTGARVPILARAAVRRGQAGKLSQMSSVHPSPSSQSALVSHSAPQGISVLSRMVVAGGEKMVPA